MVVFLLRSNILLLSSRVSAKCFCPLPRALPATFLILFLFSRPSLLQSRNAFTCRQGIPGTLPRTRSSAGSGWLWGEPREADCAWRRLTCAAGCSGRSPRVCDWWPPSCHCRGVSFESEMGRPQQSGSYTAAQSSWERASWQGEPGGPLPSLDKIIF